MGGHSGFHQNRWTIAVEQTVAGLQGLSQPEDRTDDWQRAVDEIADIHLEGEGEQTDADAAIQRKRPDAWAVSWKERRLLILEFTRPNLGQLGMTATRAEHLMRNMASQALTELTDVYSVRYDALQRLQHAQHA